MVDSVQLLQLLRQFFGGGTLRFVFFSDCQIASFIGLLQFSLD